MQEIKEWTGVTRIPEQPGAVLGVLNLRGNVVPVIHLRVCFGLEPLKIDAATVELWFADNHKTKTGTIGLAVGAVSDVENFAASSIKPAPDVGVAKAPKSLRGIAKADAEWCFCWT